MHDCWIVIQTYDYDWISIFDVMDCMLSAWGSLELTPKFQKPVAVTLQVLRLATQVVRQAVATSGAWRHSEVRPAVMMQ